MRVLRYPENPLVSPRDVFPSQEGFDVIGAFNAGVIEHAGEILMLMRVAERPLPTRGDTVGIPVYRAAGSDPGIEVLEYRKDTPGINLSDPRVVGFPDRIMLTSISHLRLARSTDGRHFTVDKHPALAPDRESEAYGLEDPRITRIGDTYYIVYKGVSHNGITQCLATTKDFVTFEKHGILFVPENMDAILFPAKIGGRYVALHRPLGGMLVGPSMWIAYSDDTVHWGQHHFLLGKSTGGWDSGRVGGGAVPFLTDRGWLEIYHAATPENHYCLGAMLLDAEHPEKLLAKTTQPILAPEAPYETSGFMKNVVFTCGALVDGDRVSVYYGASDEVMAGADLSLAEIMDALEPVV